MIKQGNSLNTSACRFYLQKSPMQNPNRSSASRPRSNASLLAQASEDIGRTASSLSDQLVSDLLAEMLAKYSADTKSARTIEWFEDLLLGNANEGSSERDMDAAMKALAIRAESITEQCSRAQQDGMPEDAAVELRIALETSPQTMLPELKRAVFPQVSIQAKRWLENSGFGGSTPTPQSTVIKSQNIDLKLVELWSRRFSPLGKGDRAGTDLEAVGKDIKQMISVVKRDLKQRARHRRRCPESPSSSTGNPVLASTFLARAGSGDTRTR